MLSKLQREAHREEVNWVPWSDVMTAGTPNPSLKQSICAVYCCSGGDRYRLWPAGGSVNSGEQVGKTFECRQGAHQVHVVLAETEGGYRDVLWGYLYMAVDLGPLAAQAGLRRGGEICRETLPNIPGGDEAASHPLVRMGGPVVVFESLSPKVPGYQRAECAAGGVADEVKVADLLCDDDWAGAESLYLWAEDLAEGYILEIQGRPFGDGCADLGDPDGGRRQAGQRIRYYVCFTLYIHQLVSVFRDVG
jgi:hypothetical protein